MSRPLSFSFPVADMKILVTCIACCTMLLRVSASGPGQSFHFLCAYAKSPPLDSLSFERDLKQSKGYEEEKAQVQFGLLSDTGVGRAEVDSMRVNLRPLKTNQSCPVTANRSLQRQTVTSNVRTPAANLVRLARERSRAFLRLLDGNVDT